MNRSYIMSIIAGGSSPLLSRLANVSSTLSSGVARATSFGGIGLRPCLDEAWMMWLVLRQLSLGDIRPRPNGVCLVGVWVGNVARAVNGSI